MRMRWSLERARDGCRRRVVTAATCGRRKGEGVGGMVHAWVQGMAVELQVTGNQKL